MRADGAVDLAERPSEDAAVAVPGGTVLGAPQRELTAATIGKSSTRRTLGLVGHYALLVVLAALVLVPIVLVLIQALSPPFPYLDAGRPLHPVAVEWKEPKTTRIAKPSIAMTPRMTKAIDSRRVNHQGRVSRKP